ncbi:hypothetical protein AVEN_84485-1 [Araneus ventricosus]|uniref:Mos1 transposase HTH domain-containing protein n=1 Tax=Araneus ventricosus TaxID=182803 RepID=A0A4Y2J796_ARAVE|nr:hypothetical protein AVEN_84485-1 [Araneus ventricosus]
MLISISGHARELREMSTSADILSLVELTFRLEAACGQESGGDHRSDSAKQRCPLRPIERSKYDNSCHRAMEQRVNIMLCYKLEETEKKTHEILVEEYGTEAVGRRRVYE